MNVSTTKTYELFYAHFEQIFAVLLQSSNTRKMRKKIVQLSFFKDHFELNSSLYEQFLSHFEQFSFLF